MRLLVLGGGVAGLATALAASRGGHQVVLAERDADTPAGDVHSFPTRRSSDLDRKSVV